MGHIIISLPFLGHNFSPVVFHNVGFYAEQKKFSVDTINEINNGLQTASSGEEFKTIIEQHFKDEIKIILE